MPLFRPLAKVAGALLAALIAAPGGAHEFWIDPLSYEYDVGARIMGELRNGENFKGGAFPYLNESFARFEIADRNGLRPVAGRRGDRPALNVEAERGSLHVVVYESTMYSLTYTEFEKFETFVRSKALDWVLDEHAARGYPTDKVREVYYRYPKALIKVGSGAGRDAFMGQPFELVAEINPYSAAAKDGVRVRLYLDGEPHPGADIQIFHYPGGARPDDAPGAAAEAVKDHVTTDATGRAVIPVFDGGAFLVNATHIRDPRPEGAAKSAHWESVWATLTYEVKK